jgi:hypothetical protein
VKIAQPHHHTIYMTSYLSTTPFLQTALAATDVYGGKPAFFVHFVTSGILAMIAVSLAVFAVVVLWRKLRTRAWARAAAYCVLAMALIPVRPFLASLWLQYKWLIVISFIALALWHRRSTARGGRGLLQKKALIAAVLAFPVLVALSIIRQYSFEGDQCARMMRDSRITPIFSLCDTDWRKRIVKTEPHGAPPLREISQDPRTVFPSSDGRSLYCGLAYQDLETPLPLIKVDLESKKIQKVYYLYSAFRGECAPGEGVCFVASPMKRGLLEIDDARDVISREIRLVHYTPLFLGMDLKRGEVLLTPTTNEVHHDTSWGVIEEQVAEQTIVPDVVARQAAEHKRRGRISRLQPRIWIYNWRNRSVRSVLQNDEFPMTHGMTLYDRGSEILYSVNGAPTGSVFAAPRPGVQSRGIKIGVFNFLMGMGVGNGLAVDVRSRTLFAGMPMHGAVYAFDTRARRYSGRIGLEPGVRDLAFDSRRNLLYAAGYLSGNVFVIDPRTRKIKDRVFVGRKVRHIFYSASHDRLFTSSANGCLEVEPHWKR